MYVAMHTSNTAPRKAAVVVLSSENRAMYEMGLRAQFYTATGGPDLLIPDSIRIESRSPSMSGALRA